MEVNWEQKIKKWGRGIKLEDTTDDDLQDYLDTKIYQDELDKTSDDNLWDPFRDDFKNFTGEKSAPYSTTAWPSSLSIRCASSSASTTPTKV